MTKEELIHLSGQLMRSRSETSVTLNLLEVANLDLALDRVQILFIRARLLALHQAYRDVLDRVELLL